MINDRGTYAIILKKTGEIVETFRVKSSAEVEFQKFSILERKDFEIKKLHSKKYVEEDNEG